MDLLSKFLSSKVEFLSSSLYSIMLWTVNLPLFHLKNPKQPRNHIQDDLQVGLKTLIYSEAKQAQADVPSIAHCYTLTTASKRGSTPPSSLSMFRSSVMDDLIGTESGDYTSSNVEDLKGGIGKAEARYNRSRPRYRSGMRREFPPPIPLLAQAGNSPWVFKREYIDGRLIIRAEKVKHYEYLEAHRENGRLTMKLVPLDQTLYCEDCGHPITDNEEEQFQDDEDVGRQGSLFQKSRFKNEAQQCGDSSACLKYDDGLVQDSDPFWKGSGIEAADGYLGRPDSGPLRPVTTVM